jgi:Arc/MetJ-type ribon-helix-helix transcriptional regulator
MPEAEKITINMNVVDLGKVDLLVEEGFYSNRTDFIRTAIRNQLSRHEDDVRHSVTRRAILIGVLHYDRAELEEIKASGEMLTISAVGLLSIGTDVPPELALQTIQSVKVIGVFRASKSVKEALADRIH